MNDSIDKGICIQCNVPTTTTMMNETNNNVAGLPQQQQQDVQYHHHYPVSIVPIYLMKITLLYFKPKTWRLVEVYADTTLQTFHTIIQICMNFYDEHLYKFMGNNKKVYMKQSQLSTCILSDVFINVNDTMKYVYDFGSEWNFIIELQGIIPPPPRSPPISMMTTITATPNSTTVQEPFKKTSKKKRTTTVEETAVAIILRYPRIIKGRNAIVEYLYEDETYPSQPQYYDIQYYQMKLDEKFHP